MFTVRSGIVSGRGHLLFGINCQDSLRHASFEVNGEEFHVGFVCDGCGEGERSEVGANLASGFLTHRTEILIKSGMKIENISKKLFFDLIFFLQSIMNNYDIGGNSQDVKVSFIKNNLLFTVFGYVIGHEETTIFSMGDGIILINDDLDIKDQQNRPLYPAYHIVDKRYLAKGYTKLPGSFETILIKTSDLDRLAIGTDAWADELGALFSLWEQGKYFSLQREMNVLSKKFKRFKDDAALITVERCE